MMGGPTIGDRIAWAIYDGMEWLFDHPKAFFAIFALWLAAKVIHAS